MVICWLVLHRLIGALSGRHRPRTPSPTIDFPPLDEPGALEVTPEGATRPYHVEAIDTLARLRHMDNPRFPAVLGALRRMNAYAFEELLAICLRERGLAGYCPPNYSHDGGIDALAFYEGRAVVVQAKRWRRHVSAQDLRALADVADRVAGIGLFVHTGRTGRMSWRVARKREVNVLSGSDLVDFVLGQAVTMRWVAPVLPEYDAPLPDHLHSALEFARQVPASV